MKTLTALVKTLTLYKIQGYPNVVGLVSVNSQKPKRLMYFINCSHVLLSFLPLSGRMKVGLFFFNLFYSDQFKRHMWPIEKTGLGPR